MNYITFIFPVTTSLINAMRYPVLKISILCVQFFAHTILDVVVDACPERSRRDEIQFLIGETVMLG